MLVFFFLDLPFYPPSFRGNIWRNSEVSMWSWVFTMPIGILSTHRDLDMVFTMFFLRFAFQTPNSWQGLCSWDGKCSTYTKACGCMDWADLNCGVYILPKPWFILVHWLLQGVKLPGSVGSWNPFWPGFRVAPWDGTVRQEVLEKFGSVLASASTVLQAASVRAQFFRKQPKKLPTETGENHHGSKVGVFLVSTCFNQGILWHTDAKTTQVTRFLVGSLQHPIPWPCPHFGGPHKTPKFHGFINGLVGKMTGKMTGTPFFFPWENFRFPVDSHGKNLQEVHWIQHLPGFLLDIWMSLAGIKMGTVWVWAEKIGKNGEFTQFTTNIAMKITILNR